MEEAVRDTVPQSPGMQLLSQPCLGHNPSPYLPENNLSLGVALRDFAFGMGWCLLASVAFAAPDAAPSSFERATIELKGYCIERVCLGVTPEAVSKLGDIKWDQAKFPDGVLTCSDSSLSNYAAGKLTAADGTEFALRFELVDTNGTPISRYRLTSAAIKLPKATSLQVDDLIESLRTRVGAGTKGVSIFGAWYGESKSKQFQIRVEKQSEGVLQTAVWQIALTGGYRFKKQWLLRQQACRTDLPKL